MWQYRNTHLRNSHLYCVTPHINETMVNYKHWPWKIQFSRSSWYRAWKAILVFSFLNVESLKGWCRWIYLRNFSDRFPFAHLVLKMACPYTCPNIFRSVREPSSVRRKNTYLHNLNFVKESRNATTNLKLLLFCFVLNKLLQRWVHFSNSCKLLSINVLKEIF